MKKITLLPIITLLFFINSCKESCEDLGKTFNEVKLNSWLVNSNELQVYIDFEACKKIDSDYFFQSSTTHSKEVDTAFFVSNSRLVVNIPLINIIDEDVKKIEVMMKLPDRQKYAKCSHWGTDNIYYLNLSLNIVKITDNVYEASDIEWKESKISAE